VSRIELCWSRSKSPELFQLEVYVSQSSFGSRFFCPSDRSMSLPITVGTGQNYCTLVQLRFGQS